MAEKSATCRFEFPIQRMVLSSWPFVISGKSIFALANHWSWSYSCHAYWSIADVYAGQIPHSLLVQLVKQYLLVFTFKFPKATFLLTKIYIRPPQLLLVFNCWWTKHIFPIFRWEARLPPFQAPPRAQVDWTHPAKALWGHQEGQGARGTVGLPVMGMPGTVGSIHVMGVDLYNSVSTKYK